MPPVTRFDRGQLWRSTRSAVLALIAPVVILRGMSSGIVTPTEAGVLASLYALLVGAIERTLTFPKLLAALRDTVESSALILFIVAASSVVSYMFVAEGTAASVTTFFADANLSAAAFMIVAAIILLVVGCLIETMPALLLTVPLLLPTAKALGIDPVQFGLLTIFNLLIGIMTPPMGIGLYILSAVSGISFGRLAWAAIPFVVLLIILLMIFSFVPEIVLWLPDKLIPVA